MSNCLETYLKRKKNISLYDDVIQSINKRVLYDWLALDWCTTSSEQNWNYQTSHSHAFNSWRDGGELFNWVLSPLSQALITTHTSLCLVAVESLDIVPHKQNFPKLSVNPHSIRVPSRCTNDLWHPPRLLASTGGHDSRGRYEITSSGPVMIFL